MSRPPTPVHGGPSAAVASSRRKSQAPSPSSPHASKKKRGAVSFDARVEVIAAAPQAPHYSPGEVQGFQQELLRDVRRLRAALAAPPPPASSASSDPDAILDECVGIEAFLAPSEYRQAMEARQRHMAAVLNEQAAQERRGRKDPSWLGRVAEASSLRARTRARELAWGNLGLR